MGRWSHAVAAVHAQLLELALRQERSALHFTIVDNISGAHFARQRHRDEELVYALGGGSSRLASGDQVHPGLLRVAQQQSQQLRAGEGRGWEGAWSVA